MDLTDDDRARLAGSVQSIVSKRGASQDEVLAQVRNLVRVRARRTTSQAAQRPA